MIRHCFRGVDALTETFSEKISIVTGSGIQLCHPCHGPFTRGGRQCVQDGMSFACNMGYSQFSDTCKYVPKC
jgi:hypothetical protein